jgi:hypothetical protein
MKCSIHYLTYSIQQNPSWEANRFAASQEIPHILWNPKVHYRIHKCPPPVPILSKLDLVHTPTSQFRVRSILILTCHLRLSSKWCLSLRFPHQNPVHASPLPHTYSIPRPSHFSRFNYRRILGEQYRSVEFIIMLQLHRKVSCCIYYQIILRWPYKEGWDG